MSILNRPSDGLLSVLIALHKAVRGFGEHPEADLLKLVAPQSVVPDGKAEMIKKTLTRWKQLGFFREEGGLIGLSPTVASVPSDNFNSFRAAILRLLLSPENNPGVLEVSGDDTEASKASDCTRAISWVLAQDIYAFPASYKGVESLQHDQNVQPKVFTNDTRWAGFAEWAVFLGAGYEATKLPFVPCPAFAVASVLNEVFSDKSELQQTEFFRRLAGSMPVVDGGSYRLAVEAQIEKPWRIQLANEVSLSLSAALLSLEARGFLRLEARSDAPSRTLLGRSGREPRPVSHFIRQGAK
jgi:hypothetical protein